MTHDELLAKINADSIYFDYPHPDKEALRAVVELAKTYHDDQFVKEEFNQGAQFAFDLVIQAIEKALA